MSTLEYKDSLLRYRRYLQSVQSKPLFKASLFLVLSLSLLIVLIFAALRPTLITIATLVGEINQQKELVKKLDHKINLVKQAQKELTAVSDRLIYLDQALPTSADVASWTDTVERIASENGLEVKQVSLSSIVTPLEFDLSMTGQYGQVVQFLQILQGTRRLIKIDQVSITHELTDEASTNTLLLNVTGSVAFSQ